MEKIVIAVLETEDNVYLKVSDVVDIERVPIVVKEFISNFVKSMKIMESGLPASGFVGKSGVKITGIFKYGELGFISYEGNKEDLEAEELVHIFSNVSEKDYDEIKRYADEELKKLEDNVSKDRDTKGELN